MVAAMIAMMLLKPTAGAKLVTTVRSSTQRDGGRISADPVTKVMTLTSSVGIAESEVRMVDLVDIAVNVEMDIVNVMNVMFIAGMLTMIALFSGPSS